jgi:hypothetical protein
MHYFYNRSRHEDVDENSVQEERRADFMLLYADIRICWKRDVIEIRVFKAYSLETICHVGDVSRDMVQYARPNIRRKTKVCILSHRRAHFTTTRCSEFSVLERTWLTLKVSYPSTDSRVETSSQTPKIRNQTN